MRDRYIVAYNSVSDRFELIDRSTGKILKKAFYDMDLIKEAERMNRELLKGKEE